LRVVLTALFLVSASFALAQSGRIRNAVQLENCMPVARSRAQALCTTAQRFRAKVKAEDDGSINVQGLSADT
jgi:hypothetical protein